MKKKVVVMGKGVLAVKVAEWFFHSEDYELICVVPNIPESSWTLSLRDWAEKRAIPFVASGKVTDIPGSEEEGWVVDLAVSVTYDKIIKPMFIGKCRKIINIHNSPLPKYRGVNPINWALKNAETSHGVTIHEITPGIDDGPIISQIIFPIDPEHDEVVDVYERCLHFGWLLFKRAMLALWLEEPVAQDGSLATYYSSKYFDRLGDRSFFTRDESRKKLNL